MAEHVRQRVLADRAGARTGLVLAGGDTSDLPDPEVAVAELDELLVADEIARPGDDDPETAELREVLGLRR